MPAYFDEYDKTLPHLIRTLAEPDPTISGDAIELLKNLGAITKPAIPDLSPIALNPKHRRRALAVLAIAEIDAEDPRAQEAFADALSAGEPAEAFAAVFIRPQHHDHLTMLIVYLLLKTWWLDRFPEFCESASPAKEVFKPALLADACVTFGHQ